MNAGLVVKIPWGGGETKTLPYPKEFEFFALTGGGDAKTSDVSNCVQESHSGTFTTFNYYCGLFSNFTTLY